MACHGQGPAHALEDIAHVLVSPLDHRLIISFGSIDGGDDVLGIGGLQGDVSEVLLQTEVDVAVLEVVVVHLDAAGEGVGLRVDQPAGLPLSAPEGLEARVDAADVDLEVAVLVEAEAGPGRSISVVLLDVLVHGLFNPRPTLTHNTSNRRDVENGATNAIVTGYLLVLGPLLVELLREVTRVTEHRRLERARVKGEPYAQLRIKVNEWILGGAVLCLGGVLPANLGDHGDASIWELYVLLMQFEVLFHRSLDIFVVEYFPVNNIAEIFENHVDFSHW